MKLRRAPRVLSSIAALLLTPWASAAQEVKLNGPLVRQAAHEILGFGTGSGTEAFLWGDLEVDGRFELFRVDLSGAQAPMRVSGALVAGGDVGGDEAESLTFEGVVALAPAGDRIVYAADARVEERVELFSVKPQGGAPVRLSGEMVTGGDVALDAAERPFRITPDGARVLYLADQEQDGVVELFVAPIDGGTPALRLSGPMVAGGDVADFQISQDGSRVVYRADQARDGVFELFGVPVDGSAAPVPLCGSPTSGGVRAAQDYEISRDGRHVAYRSDQLVTGQFELFSARLEGAPFPLRLSRLLSAGGDVTRFSIAPDGDGVVYLADAIDNRFRLFHVPIRGRQAPRELNAALATTADVNDYALAALGGRFAYVASDSGVFAGPLDGSTTPVRVHPALVASGRVTEIAGLTRDGERVLYRADALVDERFRLFSAPLHGGGPATEISTGLGPEADVLAGATRLTADGLWVVYAADPEEPGRTELFATRVDGTGAPGRLNLDLGPRAEIAARSGRLFRITDDSAAVLHLADRELDGQHELHAAPIDAAEPAHQVTHTPPGPIVGDVERIFLTPDGTRALYVADEEEDQRHELYSVPTDGSLPRTKLSSPADGNVEFLGPGSAAVVSADGSRVLYLQRHQGSVAVELFSAPVDGSAPAVKLNGPLVANGRVSPIPVALTPDGTGVVYAATEISSTRADLFLAPIDGLSARVRLNEPPEGSVLALAIPPGGSRVVFVAGSDLFSVPLDGSSPPLRLNPPHLGFRNVAVFGTSSLVFAPDGGRVLYLADALQADEFELFAVPVDGSSAPLQLSERALTGAVDDAPHQGSLASSAQVASDGQLAVFRGTSLFSRRLDGSGSPAPLHPPLVPPERLLEFALSPSLPVAAFSLDPDSSSPARLFAAPADASNAPLQLADGLVDLPFLSFPPSFAANGARVLFHSPFLAAPGSVLIALDSVPVDGNAAPVRLSPPGLGAGMPQVSGSLVLFQTQDLDGAPGLFAARADGSAPAEMLSSPLAAGTLILEFLPGPTDDVLLYRADREAPSAFELFAVPIVQPRQVAGKHR